MNAPGLIPFMCNYSAGMTAPSYGELSSASLCRAKSSTFAPPHFAVNHGQKRFNAWTYEKIPSARMAIDAIIRDLQGSGQDRTNRAAASREEGQLSE